IPARVASEASARRGVVAQALDGGAQRARVSGGGDEPVARVAGEPAGGGPPLGRGAGGAAGGRGSGDARDSAARGRPGGAAGARSALAQSVRVVTQEAACASERGWAHRLAQSRKGTRARCACSAESGSATRPPIPATTARNPSALGMARWATRRTGTS